MEQEKKQREILQGQLHKKVLECMDLSKDVEGEEVYEIIDKVILEEGKKHYISNGDKTQMRKEIFAAIRGLDILQDILEDNEITEIMVNGPNRIFVEKKGKIYPYPKNFSSEDRLRDVIQNIVAKVNRRVNEASPIVDTRLFDGSRVNVVLKPIAIDGPVVTIRKFPEKKMQMEDLLRLDSITEEAAKFLENLVYAGYNIFVSGGTGSGKTTFLNILSNYIPSDERIITIEDSAELQISNIANLVRLEVRQMNAEGENGVDMTSLIKSALRMRPDRIVVGEVRGKEAMDMLQAMNTGHDGSLSTGHANSPKDMLSRIETMVLMGVDMPLPAIRGQIAAGLDVIVHLGRLRDKSRRVLEITEVCEYKEGEIRLNPLYRFREEIQEGSIDGQGKVCGKLERTGHGMYQTGKWKSAGLKEWK